MLQQKHTIYFILIAAAVTALFLYNPWLLYFQNDDMIHIPLSRDGVLLQHNTFRPLCDLSVILDYRLWGKQAWGYHFTNLILHVINSVLVFIVCKKIFIKYKLADEINLKAFTTAVLFWIFMNHDEAVFWILGRSAMLGMLFFLLAVLFYLKRNKGSNFIVSLLFSICAWLSYESAWILLFLFVFISLAETKTNDSKWKTDRNRVLIAVAAFLIYLLFRFYFTGSFTGLYETAGMQNIDVSFLAGNFARLAIRSWLPPSQSEQLMIFEFIALTALIVFLIIRSKNQKTRRAIIILLLIWFISLLPYLTLGIDTKGLESERFIYLPSFFICILISIIIFQLSPLLKIIIVAIVCGVNLFFLAHHAKQYRFAGLIVKNTIDAVNTLRYKDRLFAEAVPQENFGALIFRSGFVEGISWLRNENTADSIIVLSQSHSDLPLQRSYPLLYSHDLSLIADTTIKNSFTGDDVYFLYTDSSLTIVAIK